MLLPPQIGKVEPVLEKVGAQHALKANRRAFIACLRINGLDQRIQGRPWHYPIHLGQKSRSSRRLGAPGKAACGECHLFHIRFSLFGLCF